MLILNLKMYNLFKMPIEYEILKIIYNNLILNIIINIISIIKIHMVYEKKKKLLKL